MAYDAERYWAERYSTIDITKSGHIDLPPAYNAWLYKRKKEMLFKGLEFTGFSAAGASVLEIAAGTGVYVEAWRAKGVARLVGIDISAAATEHLRRRFPEYTFHKRNLADPGLADLVGRDFDVVTAVDMLYHVVRDPDFQVAIGNLAATVKPGGLLVIHDLFLREPEQDFGYIKLRPLDAYRASLDAAGFDIAWRRPSFFFSVQPKHMHSPAAMRRMERIWRGVTEPLIRRVPGVAGCMTYCADRVICGTLAEGPSFEMMICRRRRG